MEDRMTPVQDDLFADCGLDGLVQEPGSAVPFVGLWNLGNSCFFNSVLQILFCCPGFQKHLEQHKEKLEAELDTETFSTPSQTKSEANLNQKRKCKFLLELGNLFAKMRSSQKYLLCESELKMNIGSDKAIRPSGLMEVLREVYPMFEPYTQQDAQECLRCMLDILNETLATSIGETNCQDKNHKPAVSDTSCKVFGGRKYEETCLISKSDGKSLSENHDPAQTGFKESRSTAARKRGVRAALKTFSRPKVHNREQKTYRPVTPLGENKSRENMTADEAAALLTGSPVKKTKQPETSSFVPPLKKIKLNSKIPRFYKSSAFSPARPKNNTESFSISASKVTKNPFKMILKPPTKYKKLEISPPATNEKEEMMESAPQKTLTNFIEDLFQGQLVNEVRCMECENRVQRVEDFMDISLPVKETENDPSTSMRNVDESCNGLHGAGEQPAALTKPEGNGENHCSVTWGLSSFTSQEILEGENKYYCGNCRRYAEGERRLLLHQLPPVLTLHLKRFSSSKDSSLLFGNNVSKINSSLNVPLSLSLNRWCSESGNVDMKYTLFGIIVHSGITICSGHYLAYVRLRSSWVALDGDYFDESLQEYDDKWLEADDDRMRILREEEMRDIISPKGAEGTSRTPYLLFYCREETR